MHRLSTAASILAIAIVVTLSMVIACEDDDDLLGIIENSEFVVLQMGGGFERPDPIASDGTGRAFFDVNDDEDEIEFRVEVEDIQDVTLAHIHLGDTGTAGPIIVELFNAGGDPQDFDERDVLAEGTFDADDFETGDIVDMDDLIAAMEAGNTYVNVHTTTNPTGEIRGQIEER